MPAPLISLQRVSVARGEREVLHEISFQLRPGEHLAILGPNGSGKSTLLKTLTCELYPIARSGTHVSLFGHSRWDVSALRRRLGVVSAEPLPKAMLQLTGTEAVMTGFFSSSRLWPNLRITEAMRSRAATLMVRAGAEQLAHTPVGTMSSGEQRKVMIARALAGADFQTASDETSGSQGAFGLEMLLLDEPSNSLDLPAQRELHRTLRHLAQTGTTLLLITHQVSDIIPEIDRVLLMKGGNIFREGARAEVLCSAVLSELFETSITVVEREGVLAAY